MRRSEWHNARNLEKPAGVLFLIFSISSLFTLREFLAFAPTLVTNEVSYETPIEFGLFEQMCAGQTITRSRAAVGRTPSALHAVTNSFECQR